jgi:quercetin dioxygenase-like cupin family protein
VEIINLNDIATTNVTDNPLFYGGQVGLQPALEEALGGEKIGFANVKFAKGAKNKFHTHTTSQVLFVTEGTGIVATREREYTVTPGTFIFIPAGEDHWHGAADDSAFAHLSILGQPSEMEITGEG